MHTPASQTGLKTWSINRKIGFQASPEIMGNIATLTI